MSGVYLLLLLCFWLFLFICNLLQVSVKVGFGIRKEGRTENLKELS